MSGFDNATMVKINNKEVDSIKTNDGGIIYQRPASFVVTGNSIVLGVHSGSWVTGNSDIIIDWGDGTSDTLRYGYTVSSGKSHTYTDGQSKHTIKFIGHVTELRDTFEGTNIISATIPDGVVNLNNFVFKDCTSLISIKIPNSIISFQYAVFQNCTGLTSITIPNSVTTLGTYCFNGCTSLTSITIPSSVTTIDSGCFYGCSGLTSITIPSSVTTLGAYCFYACSNLNTYQLYWTDNNIITYDRNKMPNYTNTKFYVPKGQKTNYVNKGYSSDKVVERSS